MSENDSGSTETATETTTVAIPAEVVTTSTTTTNDGLVTRVGDEVFHIVVDAPVALVGWVGRGVGGVLFGGSDRRTRRAARHLGKTRPEAVAKAKAELAEAEARAQASQVVADSWKGEMAKVEAARAKRRQAKAQSH